MLISLSTCYDLKYIRENLKRFVTSLGYNAILSEDGDVFYSADAHTHDACLAEVPSCHLFVLIIGGRYGGKYIGSKKGESITNMEYKEARKHNIPTFVFVEHTVLNEHHVYNKNRENKKIKAADIQYPNVDNVKIFDFIDEVRKQPQGNAFFTFTKIEDIENTLRRQWAALFCQLLNNRNDTKHINDSLERIESATKAIELYTKEVVTSVGSEITKAKVEIYDLVRSSTVYLFLADFSITLTPRCVLEYEKFEDLMNIDDIELAVYDDDTLCFLDPTLQGLAENNIDFIADNDEFFPLPKSEYDSLNQEFSRLKREIDVKMMQFNLTPEDLL